MPHEKVLNPRARTVLAERQLLSENNGSRMHHSQRLLLPDKRRNTHSKMRLGRKPPADPQRIADLIHPIGVRALDCRQCKIINLRVRAPERTARDRDLELPRKIVELGISSQMMCNLDCQR